jgi:hypothetical protein
MAILLGGAARIVFAGALPVCAQLRRRATAAVAEHGAPDAERERGAR